MIARKPHNKKFTFNFTQFFSSIGRTFTRSPRICYLTCHKASYRVSVMRHRITSVVRETPGSRTFTGVRMLSLALGLAAAHMTASAALSARAETQAAIDAVTLARPHLTNNSIVDGPIEAKMALAR